MHRVFIVEDHEFMLESVYAFLAFEPEIEICGSARTAEEAQKEIERSAPDVVFIDVSLPGSSGIDLITKLHSRHPDLRCVMLSGHREQKYVDNALEAGALGYVVKGYPEEIVGAVHATLAGRIYTSPEVARA